MTNIFRLGLISLSILVSCTITNDRRNSFVFTETDEGIQLSEAGRPVFYYQREPKTFRKQYTCNNYLHPLYSLDGDTLTEESPDDHPYHRGIFWAWHQIFVDGIRVADGWIMQDLSLEVIKLKTDINRSAASLNVEVLWQSPNWQNNMPFIRENTIVTVHRSDTRSRNIDIEIKLRALVPNVSIGGSDDEKGYGGLCLRLKMPDDLIFTSNTGRVEPQTNQIIAGSWMDLSGSFGRKGEKSGITIVCDPQTPNYPAPWILRQTGSMQNIVYPGRQRVTLPADNDVILKYQMVIHQGDKPNFKTGDPVVN